MGHMRRTECPLLLHMYIIEKIAPDQPIRDQLRICIVKSLAFFEMSPLVCEGNGMVWGFLFLCFPTCCYLDAVHRHLPGDSHLSLKLKGRAHYELSAHAAIANKPARSRRQAGSTDRFVLSTRSIRDFACATRHEEGRSRLDAAVARARGYGRSNIRQSSRSPECVFWYARCCH